MMQQRGLGLGHQAVVVAGARLGQRSHAQISHAAGMDALPGLHVHGDIEREAVIAATTPNAQAERADLAPGQIDARGVRSPFADQGKVVEGGEQDVLEMVDQLAHMPATSAQIEQGVDDPLARRVVGDLTTAVGGHDRDGAGIEEVFAPTGLTEGEDGFMLQDPQLVGGLRLTLRGELVHGFPGAGEVDQAEVTYAQLVHKTSLICGQAARSA